MNTYLTMIFFIFTAVILAFSLLFLNFFLAYNKPDIQKLSPYECGINPLGNAREKFSIQFFLIAILFILVDIDILFLFPFAVIINDFQISFYVFWIAFLFLIIFVIGLIYEYSAGALKFSHLKSKNEL